MDLDSRKQTILQAIILEYVGNAEPVGSELLTRKYDLGGKSATIRNEMSEMLDLGLLEQPHTSSGRIPSDQGYRFYVDHLIVPSEIDESVSARLRATTTAGEALQAILLDTAKALSRLTRLMTVACTFRDSEVSVMNAHVSALGPQKGIAVFVLSNGTIVNRMLECPPGLTLEDIGLANEELTRAVLNRSLRAILKAKVPSTGRPGVDRLLANVWLLIKAQVRDLTRGIFISEGEEYLFSQPEFQRDPSAMKTLLESFSETDLLYDALNSPSETQAVVIGKENRNEQFYNLSLVRSSFFVGTNEAGVVALVGPTRMRYDTSIPLVTYTSQALTSALSRFFA